jgi:hypothetical protein
MDPSSNRSSSAQPLVFSIRTYAPDRPVWTGLGNVAHTPFTTTMRLVKYHKKCVIPDSMPEVPLIEALPATHHRQPPAPYPLGESHLGRTELSVAIRSDHPGRSHELELLHVCSASLRVRLTWLLRYHLLKRRSSRGFLRCDHRQTPHQLSRSRGSVRT